MFTRLWLLCAFNYILSSIIMLSLVLVVGPSPLLLRNGRSLWFLFDFTCLPFVGYCMYLREIPCFQHIIHACLSNYFRWPTWMINLSQRFHQAPLSFSRRPRQICLLRCENPMFTTLHSYTCIQLLSMAEMGLTNHLLFYPLISFSVEVFTRSVCHSLLLIRQIIYSQCIAHTH